MPSTTPSTDPSFRDLALQAANSAKMVSFANATTLNQAHADRVNATFAKTCPTLTRFATLCDTGVVKQFAFILHASKKMAVLSCPFPAQGRNGEEVFAGSLGDSMDFPCPVTIRMKDVRGDVLSICETRAEANAFQLPTSESNPLEEDAPPGDEQDFVVLATGPERIGIELNVLPRNHASSRFQKSSQYQAVRRHARSLALARLSMTQKPFHPSPSLV
ncbi:hypothetical protein MHU86_15651 [Fragilaria crotonensis]|nr:hypothetical protein MHU86_15651 [Fragilaria crotonensis]